MSDYKKKIIDFMFSDIKKKENLNILEFGVREESQQNFLLIMLKFMVGKFILLILTIIQIFHQVINGNLFIHEMIILT